MLVDEKTSKENPKVSTTTKENKNDGADGHENEAQSP